MSLATQRERVLSSYRRGSRTTHEVMVDTGLSLQDCSSYTRALAGEGLLTDKGPRESRPEKNVGRLPHWYEPTEAFRGHACAIARSRLNDKMPLFATVEAME